VGHVFISYSREDYETARLLADALEEGLGALRHSVWWDRKIRAGRDFNAEIDTALDTAGCVIVLWSEHSVGSTWVRAEATVGLERGVLLPLRLDDSRPSTIFRVLQTLPLRTYEQGLNAEDVTATLTFVEDLLSPSLNGAIDSGEKSEPPSADVSVIPADTSHVALSPPSNRRDTNRYSDPLDRDVLQLRVIVDQLLDRDRTDPARVARLAFSARISDVAARGSIEVSLRMVEELLEYDRQRPSGLQLADGARARDIGVAMFELLIPAELKPIVRSAKSVQLELDGLSAALPWEALISDGSDPLSLRVPFVRRLVSLGLQRHGLTNAPRTRSALVLGNVGPKRSFPNMPGAAAEARALAAQLASAGYEVGAVIGDVDEVEPDWRRVVRLLYSGPFDIIHVASLATMWGSAGNCGLPIGEWSGSSDVVFLTGRMIAQLSHPPRLAMFNNGFDARVLPPEAQRIDESALRESLIYQLLAGGTEVFIGPIDHVDDKRASTFAGEVYGALLGGERLGDAVLLARRGWPEGASIYHCYGRLDWRLSEGVG
jgi:hypothetical protein